MISVRHSKVFKLQREPLQTDDISKGFIVGDTVVTSDGNIYTCVDNKKDNAIWSSGSGGDVSMEGVLAVIVYQTISGSL